MTKYIVLFGLCVFRIFPAAESSIAKSAESCTYEYKADYCEPLCLTSRISALNPLSLKLFEISRDEKQALEFRLGGYVSCCFECNDMSVKDCALEAITIDPEECYVAILLGSQSGASCEKLQILLYSLETKEFCRKIEHVLPSKQGSYKLAINPKHTALALTTNQSTYVWAGSQEVAGQADLVGIFEHARHTLDRPPVFRDEKDVFCGDSSMVRRLHLAKGACVRSYVYNARGLYDFDCLGKHLVATGYEGAKIWHISTGHLLQNFAGYMIGRHIRFSNDGEHIVVGARDIKEYQVWQKVPVTDQRYPLISQAFSPWACPEFFAQVKTQLMRYIHNKDASRELKRTAYQALAIYCGTVSASTGEAIQKRLFTGLSEKFFETAAQV